MRTSAWLKVSTAIAAATLLLTGCGSSTDGAPAPAKSGGDTPTTADSSGDGVDSPLGSTPGTIDTGSYRTTPLPPFGPIGDPFLGRSVEGQRMAEFVTLPGEIDPALVGGNGSATYVVKNGDSLRVLTGKPVADAAQADGALAGFSTSRSTAESAGQKQLVHAVMRFPDAGAAAKAAVDMNTAMQTVPDEWGSPLATPGKIDILPDTQVSTNVNGNDFSSSSFTAHNEYVIYTWASAPQTEKDWTAQVTAKALQLQAPLIEKFPATPPEKYGELPVDVDGVLRLTVPKGGETRYTGDMAVYGPRGAAHTATDPAGALDYFDKTGMTNMSSDQTALYKTRDADSARELAGDFVKEVEVTMKMKKSTGPAGVPDAGCWALQSSRKQQFYCLVQVDKYLGEIQSQDEITAHQLASAQHKILSAAKK